MRNGYTISRSILAVTACAVTLAAVAQSTGSSPGNASGNYRIAGTVVSKIDGHPLDRARVLLRDSKSRQEPQSIFTSQDGKFVFESLKAGKYTLQGVKPGFVTAAYDQHDQYSTAIVTGAGLDTENLMLKLSPQAIISGKVLDEAGEPVRHAIVTLYRSDHFQGVNEILITGNAQTDDLGTYEFPPLQPGKYFLSVHAQPWYAVHPYRRTDGRNSDGSDSEKTNVDPSLDVAYPVTYYQNAVETDAATPIEIRGGEHLQIEMNLNPVPSLRLIFHAPANQSNGFAMPQVEQPVFNSSTYVQGTLQYIAPGLLELSGIPAGRYNIRIPGQSALTLLNGIELSKDGELDLSAAEPLATVKVSVTVPSEGVIPKGLSVALIQGRSFVGGMHGVNAKGETEIPEVPAGNYDVRILGGDKWYTIVGISADGAQVKGHSINVPAGASATIALMVAAGVEVRGVAQKAGKPFAEAMIVLVPKDVAGHRDFFRRDQSDLDGTFSLRGVVPGSYTLVAIADGWDLDWSRPEIIAGYRKRGLPVEISGKVSAPVEVKEAIEVQPK